jgi:hypothetical protein
VSNRDEVVLAEEDMGLAELEVARRLRHVCGPQHHEHRVLVQLELRPLMRVVGVFNGEIVQPELLLHGAEDVLFRFVQSEPDELIVALECSTNLFEADIGNADAATVRRAVDHRRRRRSRRFGRQGLERLWHSLQLTPVGQVLFYRPGVSAGPQSRTRPPLRT